MRFAHVRVAAVTLLSGGFLILGVLGTAQAAPAATSNTDTECQALPSSGTSTPTASPSASASSSPSHSPSASPSPSHSASPSASHSASPSASHSASASASHSAAANASPTRSSTTQSATASASAASKKTASTSPSTDASTTTATPAATLVSFLTTSPSPSTSKSGNASTTAASKLCVSVQRSQSSIKRGQTATYVVQVSTQNGPASDVSVALTAQPSSQKPAFSSGCAKGDGSASCNIDSVTANKTVSLDAQIAVASNATSVSSVKLTATASVATTAKWTPPAAAETTAVTAVSATSAKSSASSSTSPGATHLDVVPLGPVPDLNGEASQLIGAGNAAGLFPTISPSHGATSGSAATAQPTAGNTAPVSDASPVSDTSPVFTAQVIGLIALGVAIMLTVTRLSVRKRPGKPRS
jgi:hypothetical protein